MWMNEHDIDDMVDLTAQHAPQFERYARYLADWKDVVNSNSDGWPYWKAGSACAAKLSAALQDVRDSLRNGTPMPSEAVFKKALSPIKAAATRHGLEVPELGPEPAAAGLNP